MADYHTIYASHAGEYDALVSREDHAGELGAALLRLGALSPERVVVELGAGTGRLTLLLAPGAAEVYAFDDAPAMLDVARERLSAAGLPGCQLGTADNAALPVATGVADVVAAGWTLGHQVGWRPHGWKVPVRAALDEMARVARRGGLLLVIETLGTGHGRPSPPASLRPYYGLLEASGFAREAIRTDYRFESVAEAQALLGQFFGADRGAEMVAAYGAEVPECTGVWWRRVA